MFLSSRLAGYSNRQQRPKLQGLRKKAAEVSGRYFVVGGQMAGCRHILTGLEQAENWFSLHPAEGKYVCTRLPYSSKMDFF